MKKHFIFLFALVLSLSIPITLVVTPQTVLGAFTSISPTAPEIAGPHELIVGQIGGFSAHSYAQGLLSYEIFWSDGTKDFRMNFSSGDEIYFNHIFKVKGEYLLTVKAIDSVGSAQSTDYNILVK